MCLPGSAICLLIRSALAIVPGCLVISYVEELGEQTEAAVFATINTTMNGVAIVLLIAFLCAKNKEMLTRLNLYWQGAMTLNIFNTCFGLLLLRDVIVSLGCSDAASEYFDSCVSDGRDTALGFLAFIALILLTL